MFDRKAWLNSRERVQFGAVMHRVTAESVADPPDTMFVIPLQALFSYS